MQSLTISLVLIIILKSIAFGEVMFDTTPAHPILHVVNSTSEGIVFVITGEVKILRDRSRKYTDVVASEHINFNDTLKLYTNASVELLFEDNSTMLIGPVKETIWIMLKPAVE
jgi:hypothetical protein